MQVLLLRLLNKVWWKKKLVRRLSWSLPLVGVGGFLLFALAEYYSLKWLVVPSALMAALALILEICLMLSLPVSGVIHALDRLLDHWLRKRRVLVDRRPADPGRRTFLKVTAAGIPLAAVTMGGAGVGGSFAPVNVFRKRIAIENLPDSLSGLRVLHLSDLHLSHYVTLDNVVTVLEDARQFQPDLVLITGDIADDLLQLPDTLSLVNQLGAPLGCFASVGNHEYFRGLNQVRHVFDRSSVTLLINDGVRIARGSESLFVCGIDDPRFLRGVTTEFFPQCLDATLASCISEDFVLLLSHRPDVFNDAAARGVHLTLAGHTHGGQVGLFGRSLLENCLPGKYLWGHYQSRGSHLYTSCGVGHWFPFRLGCPPEAPVIELIRA